jgi:hypothetical protein
MGQEKNQLSTIRPHHLVSVTIVVQFPSAWKGGRTLGFFAMAQFTTKFEQRNRRRKTPSIHRVDNHLLGQNTIAAECSSELTSGWSMEALHQFKFCRSPGYTGCSFAYRVGVQRDTLATNGSTQFPEVSFRQSKVNRSEVRSSISANPPIVRPQVEVDLLFTQAGALLVLSPRLVLAIVDGPSVCICHSFNL